MGTIKKKFKTSWETPIDREYKVGEPSKTQQQFKMENNAYTVIDRHTRGLPVSLNQNGQYLDVSNVDTLNHHKNIQNLKKTIDEKNEKLNNDQKRQKEQNGKTEKTQNPENTGIEKTSTSETKKMD